ncbi:trichohyalin-like isoform X3 [Salarias fasciatus]|uniref:trichohyalin-like isoform X3 n=1 Tax=Salarias fasciatus TaxID=181472 RepID=UPI0011770242|nr:trichohyalin-like isoform X3 [Salarias fasciatus]
MATDKKNSNTTSSVPEAGGETIVRCRHAIQMEQQLRSVLDKKEEELRAARHEVSEMKRHYEDQIGKLSSTLHQKQQEMQTITERRQGNEQQFQARSVLDKQEEELRATRHEASEMKRNYEDQIVKLSSALHQKQQEMQTITERRQGNEQQFQASYISRITSGLQTVFQHVMSPFSSAISDWFGTPDQDFRFAQMESYYKQELQKYSCALGERANEVEGYKQRMAERESYFQRKMDEKRSILQQREEELKSFKDRVAGEVALSIKTGKNESMNNPVSKTRLKEMYEDMRLQFLTIKNRLKSSNYRPDSVKASLQGIFTTAAENMEQKTKEIDQIFGLNEANSSPVSQKVNEYRKATVQYLQLTLYHNSKEEAESKMASLQNEENPEAVMELLTSHCRWLANLLALNDPPLQPDWENHDPGMNKWDILPRNLNSSSAL